MEGLKDNRNPFRDVYAGFILGKAGFIKEKLADLKQTVESEDFSFKGALTKPIGVSEIVESITRKYGINMRKLKHRPSKEKKAAIYLRRRYSNLSTAEIGKQFGVSYSSVSKAADSLERQLHEDKRLRKEIDAIISHFKG